MESALFTVPHAIHGLGYLIVVTDALNNVYENAFENDNTNITQVSIDQKCDLHR